MSIINYTYLQKRLIAVSNLNKPYNLARLDNYIEQKEPEYLRSVLGYELYKEFSLGLNDSPLNPKWDALMNGAEFTYNGELCKWDGFNNDLKDSPIAYYVYFYMVREDNDILTGTGVVNTKNENSDRISPMVKLVDAWGYMADRNRVLKAFLETNILDYPTYKPINSLIEKINYYGI